MKRYVLTNVVGVEIDKLNYKLFMKMRKGETLIVSIKGLSDKTIDNIESIANYHRYPGVFKCLINRVCGVLLAESDNYIGIQFNKLSDWEQKEFYNQISGAVDGRTGCEPQGIGEHDCIVDFNNGLSIAGKLVRTDNETTILIDEQAAFYNAHEL